MLIGLKDAPLGETIGGRAARSSSMPDWAETLNLGTVAVLVEIKLNHVTNFTKTRPRFLCICAINEHANREKLHSAAKGNPQKVICH